MRKDQLSLVSPEFDYVRRDNEALADYQQGKMTFEAFLTLVRPSINQKVRQVYHARFSNILEPFLMEEVAQEMEMVLWKKAKHVKEGVWFAKFMKECITQSLTDQASKARALANMTDFDAVTYGGENRDHEFLDYIPEALDQNRALVSLRELLKKQNNDGGLAINIKAAPHHHNGDKTMQLSSLDLNRPYISISSVQPQPLNQRKLQLFLLEMDEDTAPEAKTYSRAKRLREDRGTPEHKELIAIYKASGLTLNAFASEMGVQREALCSYLYVNTKSVPDDVMKQARLFQDGDIKIYQRYRSKKMSEICDDWATRLGLKLEDNSTLYMIGLILGGISQLTMRRWREDYSRPTDEAINRYDLVIRLMEERIKTGGFLSVKTTIENMLTEYKVSNTKPYPGERLVKKLLTVPTSTNTES
jgi:hypothetical protein